MSVYKIQLRRTALIVAVTYTTLFGQCSVAHAGLIGTEALASKTTQADPKKALENLLARQDISTALMAHGVNPTEAKERVAALTDQEARNLVGQIEKLPAGGFNEPEETPKVMGLPVALFFVAFIALFALLMSLFKKNAGDKTTTMPKAAANITN